MRSFAMGCVLLALAGCSSGGSEDVSTATPSDLVGDWRADLDPVNNSGVDGSASVQSAMAAMTASVSITGAAANAHHPWHVHQGTCGSGGTVVGAASSYPPLHVGPDGTATARATVSTALNDDARYHVNIHRSATEMNVIMACGNLDN